MSWEYHQHTTHSFSFSICLRMLEGAAVETGKPLLARRIRWGGGGLCFGTSGALQKVLS
jgi:hypothetical protein